MSIEIKRSDQYAEFNVSAPSNRGYITIDTSSWIDKPWMFYELPALKFEIYTESDGEVIKYKNFVREIRTYNPVYSPIGVLNVTIDIRNVPEEFTLRVIPIFDNNAIAARNMLIENGIENGDIWGKDQDVPTQLFNLDLEFIECEGEYIPPIQPTHEETVTFTEPPYTFDDSDGSPIISLTIKGNGQQNGTPLPQSIIMPNFCGVRTKQIIDYTLSESGGIDASGNPVAAGNLWRSNVFYEIHGSIVLSFVKYSTLINVRVNYYDANYSHISREEFSASSASGVSLTIPTNAKYFKWTLYASSGTNINVDFVRQCYIMFNLGITALPYEPYGWAEKITCAGQTVPVYLGQTQTVRKIRKLVLTGESNINKNTPSNPNDYLYYLSGVQHEKTDCICSHLVSTDSFPIAAIGGVYSKYSSGIFYINLSRGVMEAQPSGNTVAGFKEYLATQYANGTPVTIWYVLAEPTTGIVNEPLCKIGDYADELHSTDAAVTIPTVRGQNVLTVDTPIQPSEMTITYIKEGQ